MAKNCGRLGSGVARQFGHGGDDWLIGDAGRDHLRGRAGDDHLEGGAGHDCLRGGRGNDHLSGDDGDDWLFGGHGDDGLFGGAGRDHLFGHFGDDWLEGGTERDRLHGGRGNDHLSGGDGDDLMKGGRGDDLFDGGTGNDKAYGGKGDDVFVYHAGDGNDFFHGQRGTADTIRLDVGADDWTLHLRRGEVVADDGDQLSLSAGSAGYIAFADGSTLDFKGVERIEITESPTVQAEPGPSQPLPPPNEAPSIGELSANAVYENAANDTVVGVVSATDPDAGDVLTYSLIDPDGCFAIDPTTGAITVADSSLLDHEADQHDVVVQVTDGGGLSDTAAFSIAVLFDNSGDDTLTGGAADDVIDGGPGDDSLYGEAGNDQMTGGDGADFMSGGSGADQMSGDAGDDMLFGDDGDDWLSGGDGADSLRGGLDNDRMDGGAGDDSLFGNSGDDVLNGDGGNDIIFGSLGNDIIAGGAGDDSLSGGSGADRFVFDSVGDGVDAITDFGNGDVLAIGNLLTAFVAGQEADFVNLVDDGTNTTVQVDVDGAANGSAFESIAVLNGITGTTLSALVSAGQIDFLIA